MRAGPPGEKAGLSMAADRDRWKLSHLVAFPEKGTNLKLWGGKGGLVAVAALQSVRSAMTMASARSAVEWGGATEAARAKVSHANGPWRTVNDGVRFAAERTHSRGVLHAAGDVATVERRGGRIRCGRGGGGRRGGEGVAAAAVGKAALELSVCAVRV